MALSVVATNPAFQHVDASRLAVFANAGRPRRILLGTVLMDRGDAGAHLYLLLSGRVLVERPARGFAPRRVNELEAGEFVGEAGSLPRAPQ
ncbi:MAG TPA: cyclic nucleotide-binding domain-containing protein, partial [Chloroflexota bacterium]|nr:cyclic nucleotide-binding domain-containing protein [Chloroflexota bacterium]